VCPQTYKCWKGEENYKAKIKRAKFSLRSLKKEIIHAFWSVGTIRERRMHSKFTITKGRSRACFRAVYYKTFYMFSGGRLEISHKGQSDLLVEGNSLFWGLRLYEQLYCIHPRWILVLAKIIYFNTTAQYCFQASFHLNYKNQQTCLIMCRI